MHTYKCPNLREEKKFKFYHFPTIELLKAVGIMNTLFLYDNKIKKRFLLARLIMRSNCKVQVTVAL